MQRYRVTDGKDFTLAKWDPGDTGDFDGGKSEGRAQLTKLTARLDELQDTFYADGRHKLLVVLQGTDTSGKGGAIRKTFEGLNPAGVHFASFKAPTESELAHDFLWRVHSPPPAHRPEAIFHRRPPQGALLLRGDDPG